MPAVLLAVLQVLGRAAAAGTLDEIVTTAAKLVALVLPLVKDKGVQAELAEILATLQLGIRPAQPEDPAMMHAEGHRFGGR